LQGVAWLGTAFLFVFALRSFYRAYRPQTLAGTDVHGAQTSMGAAIGTALLLTFLNPHVYLDTVLVLGGIASRFDGWDRAFFAGGAMLASALWFYPLGFGAKKLRKYMNRPMTWRVIDSVIGTLMLILAVSLAGAAWRGDF